MTAPNMIPDIKISPPDGELLYVNPYIGEKVTIDGYGNVQITPGYLRTDWDGVYDSLPKYKFDPSGLVYDGSYPPTCNISGGILYVDQGHDVIDSAAECQWKEVEGVYINDIANPPDTSTEPSDLKNTKSNIRKIKPDINSDLKRV